MPIRKEPMKTQIEAKLKEHRVRKVVPDGSVLEQVYRDQLRDAFIRDRISEIEDQADDYADSAKVPKTLARKVRAELRSNPSMPWDRVVADIANKAKRSH